MEFVGERGLQQEQLVVALHAAQAGFELQDGGGAAAQFLITRAPVTHALRVAFELRHHILDQVRRLEADDELREDADPMQRQLVLQPIVQALRGRRVDRRQLGDQSMEGALRVCKLITD